MKTEWIYCIIRALEARLQWINDDIDGGPQEERQAIIEALRYFRNLEIKE